MAQSKPINGQFSDNTDRTGLIAAVWDTCDQSRELRAKVNAVLAKGCDDRKLIAAARETCIQSRALMTEADAILARGGTLINEYYRRRGENE